MSERRTAPITPAELQRLAELEKQATPGPWYAVGQPWLRDIPTYIIAGHQDPHIGTPVLDAIGIDEWEDKPGEEQRLKEQAQTDLELAAALRNSFPGLFARVRELEEALANVEKIGRLAEFPSDEFAATGRNLRDYLPEIRKALAAPHTTEETE